MAQGTVKPSKKTTGSTTRNNRAGITRKGPQNLPPKKSAAIKRQKALTTKFSSGLVSQTEKMLGEKAGHLELLGGGRKKGNNKVGGSKGGEKKKSGGSQLVKKG